MHDFAPDEYAPILAETDLGAIRHNVRVLRQLAAPADLLAVVKADAYGHGAVPVATVLVEEGVDRLAVATVGEAAELRAAGIDARILVFAAPLPDALPAYVRMGLDATVSSPDVAKHVVDVAQRVGPLTVHLKVDTGMHRIGVSTTEAPDVLRLLHETPGVTVEALWTHLATADGDLDLTRRQLAAFDGLAESLGDAMPPLRHVSNGPLLMRMQAAAAQEGTLVRIGGVLYGMASSQELRAPVEESGLRPALTLSTRVVHLQTVPKGESVSYGQSWVAPEERRIATLTAGYADGVPRGLSNSGHVGIGGRLVPIVGRVCMDMLMVDLGSPEDAARVQIGDRAVVFGPGGPDVLDQAIAAETIPYELTCALATRVPRVFHDKPSSTSPESSAGTRSKASGL